MEQLKMPAPIFIFQKTLNVDEKGKFFSWVWKSLSSSFFFFKKISIFCNGRLKTFELYCTAAACMRAHIRTFPRMFPRQAKLQSPQVMFLMFFFTFYFEKEMSSSKPFWTVGWKWICTQLSFSCVLYSTYPMSLIWCVLQNSNFLAKGIHARILKC